MENSGQATQAPPQPISPTPASKPVGNSNSALNIFLTTATVISILIAAATSYLLFGTRKSSTLITNQNSPVTTSISEFTFKVPAASTKKFFPITSQGALTAYSVNNPSENYKLEDKVDSGGGAIYFGSSDPLVSPDLTRLAYIKDSKLWISSADGKDKTQLSPSPQVSYLNSWSPDSRYLLVYATSQDITSMYGPGVEDTKQFDPTLMPGGYYLLDTKNGVYKRIEPLTGVVTWVDNNTVLIYLESNKEYALFNVESFTANTKTFRDSADLKKSFYPQINANGQSDKWVMNIGELNGNVGTSSIVYATFPNTTGTQIASGGWAQYQFPILSPDSTKVIYSNFKKVEVWDGTSSKSLVDGRQVMWIDNNRFIYFFQPETGGAKTTYFVYDLTSNKSTPLN